MSVEGKTSPNCLEVLVKQHGQPYLRVALDHSPAVIGRDSEASVRLDSKKVSRNHARLEFSERGIRIIDSGSRNGFKVDGEQTEQASLTSKNTVKIADFEFRIRLTSSPRVTPGQPLYYTVRETPDQTTASERAVLVSEKSESRLPPAPTQAFALDNELSEGWAEI
ncbi:MAG: FHA domain-containing protein, partial [Myxococcota bacterium]